MTKNDISIIDVASGNTTIAGNTCMDTGHGRKDMDNPISWSHDFRWITFSEGLEKCEIMPFLYIHYMKRRSIK